MNDSVTLETADAATLRTAAVLATLIAQMQIERIRHLELVLAGYESVLRKKPRGRPRKNAPKTNGRGRGRPPKWPDLAKQLDALQTELSTNGEASTQTDAAFEFIRRLLPHRADPKSGRQVRELRREITNLVKRASDQRTRATKTAK